MRSIIEFSVDAPYVVTVIAPMTLRRILWTSW